MCLSQKRISWLLITIILVIILVNLCRNSNNRIGGKIRKEFNGRRNQMKWMTKMRGRIWIMAQKQNRNKRKRKILKISLWLSWIMESAAAEVAIRIMDHSSCSNSNKDRVKRQVPLSRRVLRWRKNKARIVWGFRPMWSRIVCRHQRGIILAGIIVVYSVQSCLSSCRKRIQEK